MAIYFRGMNFEESFQLTKSMMNVINKIKPFDNQVALLFL